MTINSSILVIDDKADILNLVKIILEMEKYEVDIALGGAKGIEKAKNKKYDLVLLDIMMPEIDGYQVVKELKKDPQTKEMKVIALTAKAQNKDKDEALTKGFDGYIPKPFRANDLIAEVEKYLLTSKSA